MAVPACLILRAGTSGTAEGIRNILRKRTVYN